MKLPKVIAAIKLPTTKEAYLQLKVLLPYKKSTLLQLVHLITHIKAKDGMLHIYLKDKTIVHCQLSITCILALLPAPQFLQCHESYIINSNYITEHIAGDGGDFMINKLFRIPISRLHKEEAMIALAATAN